MISILDIGSSEEIALFNPAFLARIIRAAADDYQKAAARDMQVPLAFLLIPLSLHKPTRDDLPTNASSQMQTWIREHPRHLAQFDARVLGMRPFIALAVRFGVRHGVLTSADGGLGAGTVKRRPRGHTELESAEVEDCMRVASFLGRWFARQPDMATLLALWGLQP